jgi:hypothetical protein
MKETHGKWGRPAVWAKVGGELGADRGWAVTVSHIYVRYSHREHDMASLYYIG